MAARESGRPRSWALSTQGCVRQWDCVISDQENRTRSRSIEVPQWRHAPREWSGRLRGGHSGEGRDNRQCQNVGAFRCRVRRCLREHRVGARLGASEGVRRRLAITPAMDRFDCRVINRNAQHERRVRLRDERREKCDAHPREQVPGPPQHWESRTDLTSVDPVWPEDKMSPCREPMICPLSGACELTALAVAPGAARPPCRRGGADSWCEPWSGQ